jgi:hypothetical protein
MSGLKAIVMSWSLKVSAESILSCSSTASANRSVAMSAALGLLGTAGADASMDTDALGLGSEAGALDAEDAAGASLGAAVGASAEPAEQAATRSAVPARARAMTGRRDILRR